MAVRSWVESANVSGCDFPIHNLPYGVFRAPGGESHIGVAIGDQILDLRACAEEQLLASESDALIAACRSGQLNALMGLGKDAWSSLRRCLTALLDGEARAQERSATERLLVPMRGAEMQVPAAIGDYTDFYASIYHASRVGKLFRSDNPLLPNYKYVPIGYHGRASSIVISGTEIRRPSGQTKQQDAEPTFGPSRSLDFELEMGLFVGPGNALGRAIPASEAEEHLFGLCLVNDWSARDIQAWEYQPLGPFLAKSFATTVSPWVVTMEALEPYRVAMPQRPQGDPEPLPYLRSGTERGIDVQLEVYLDSAKMREGGMGPMLLSGSNMQHLYWSPAQLIAHHSSNGCNLRPGDLLATGTISGPDEGSEGCLLEMKHRSSAISLPNGETRNFLMDGDTVTFRGYCERPGLARIGFGECRGTVLGAA